MNTSEIRLPLATPGPRAVTEFGELWSALASQYAVERELGRGGMGVVYAARDVRLDRLVAIKVLPPHLAADADVRERFLREARTAGRLSHPNIVPVFRADEVAGHPFFAMPYIEGQNLAERVRDRGPMTPADAVRHLREVAWALAYAHARGVIHRDVKPENIMLELESRRALVTDFGIARVEFGPKLVHDDLIVGTAHYMSPEQINGETLDGRTDLYALGVVGYLILSGRQPFSAPTVSALLAAQLTEPAPPLLSVAPGVPAPIAEVIDRCLCKPRDARYATGEALADALEKALRMSEPTPSRADYAAVDTALSPQDALAVWRRAAALQVADLERRAEELPAAAALSVREVESAATAAGISRQFIAQALAEITAAPR
jgi:serine/threonine-protein kinase